MSEGPGRGGNPATLLTVLLTARVTNCPSRAVFARSFADPVDDLVVGRLAGGDAFDDAGVDLDVGRAPGQAVGVEEACREHSGSVGWASTWPNDANGAGRADSASTSRGSLTMASCSTASRKAATSM